MTDADVYTLKGVVKALAALRTGGESVPTLSQAAELATLGERAATDALLCVLGVAMLTADHNASYIGWLCIQLAGYLAEAHPQQPTSSEVLQLLARIASETRPEATVAVTSLNKSDQGAN